jgi:hypothetical protein
MVSDNIKRTLFDAICITGLLGVMTLIILVLLGLGGVGPMKRKFEYNSTPTKYRSQSSAARIK